MRAFRRLASPGRLDLPFPVDISVDDLFLPKIDAAVRERISNALEEWARLVCPPVPGKRKRSAKYSSKSASEVAVAPPTADRDAVALEEVNRIIGSMPLLVELETERNSDLTVFR